MKSSANHVTVGNYDIRKKTVVGFPDHSFCSYVIVSFLRFSSKSILDMDWFTLSAHNNIIGKYKSFINIVTSICGKDNLYSINIS